MITSGRLILLLCWGAVTVATLGCHTLKTSASGDASATEAGLIPGEDGRGFKIGMDWITCGGTVTLTGETPLGPLSLTEVFVYLPYCPRRLVITLREKWSQPPPNGPRSTSVYDGPQLDLVIPLPADARGPALIGLFQASTTVTIPGTPPVTTRAAVDVNSADDPFPNGGAPHGADIIQPPGSIAGTFSLADDSYSLSGSFDSPYCASHDECSTL